MITTNLTKPVSKKLFIAMLLITIGAEVVLYLIRYSNFFGTIYDSIMVASFFIGWRLFQRIENKGQKMLSWRKKALKFTNVTIIFFAGSIVLNAYSTFFLDNLSQSNDESNPVYRSSVSYENVPKNNDHSFFRELDEVGYDFYSDILAGLEEVSRYTYIILFLLLFKKLFAKKWEYGKRDGFLLSALFLSSLLFGVDHTLDIGHNWVITIGTIVHYTNMGLFFGILLLWTRSLWIMVGIHALYDVTISISYYYYDMAPFVCLLIAIILHALLFISEKRYHIKKKFLTSGAN